MKIPKQAYTLEFKELAVKRVKDGQALAGVAKDLGAPPAILLDTKLG